MAQTRNRRVILTIDSIGRLLMDYIGNSNIPVGAKPVRLMVNPQEQGRLCVVVDHPDIPENAKDIFVHFDLKRIYKV